MGVWEYFLVREKKADPARILLVGRSLGGRRSLARDETPSWRHRP